MKLALLALYGGPDQIMGVASGVATIVGILLMLWNKILVTIGKAVNWISPSRRKPDAVPPAGSQQAD
jgi:hypothetical protein